MKITSKNREELNFLESGLDGIYVLDHVVFRDQFDGYANESWEKSTFDGYEDYCWENSTGKKKLQKWAEENLSKEILEEFEVDIPTVEEVFSQKMFNLYKPDMKRKSKQFPVFRDSDNRMMEFDGEPMCWWTKSIWLGEVNYMSCVDFAGNVSFNSIYRMSGFVPVLRRKNEKLRGD